MKKISYDLFPDGKRKALTLSYDDATVDDRKMVEILNQYGIKGTFHLNSGWLDLEGRVTAAEVRSLYAGHEVAAHTVSHPYLPYIPVEQRVNEIMQDRQALEKLVGYPVKGMSYPFGEVTDEVAKLLPQLGIDYCRTVHSQLDFTMPEHFHRWHPTCHHLENLLEFTEQFLQLNRPGKPLLFYVWGHSFEFARDDNWDLLVQFCEQVGGRDEIWYATNKQIFDYVQALKRLEVSVDGSMIYNPSAMPVWFSVDGDPVKVDGGQLLQL